MIAEIVVIPLERDIADCPRAAEGNLGSHAAGSILAFVGVDFASVECVPNLKVASINREGNEPSVLPRWRGIGHVYSHPFYAATGRSTGTLTTRMETHSPAGDGLTLATA